MDDIPVFLGQHCLTPVHVNGAHIGPAQSVPAGYRCLPVVVCMKIVAVMVKKNVNHH